MWAWRFPESAGHPPAGIESVVWADPHVGADHGFVEFVRVVDDEATLLVTAADPLTSPLEAWRPMLEDLGSGDAYEWVIASKAWAAEWATNRQFPFLNMSDALKHTYPPFADAPISTPWPSTDGLHPMPVLAQSETASKGGNSAANPWNAPTAMLLRPGESVEIGFGCSSRRLAHAHAMRRSQQWARPCCELCRATSSQPTLESAVAAKMASESRARREPLHQAAIWH